MRLQTDQEFQQNEIKGLNASNNITMLSAKTWGGKAFAAEQKIRELKKLIKKATSSLNKTRSGKYGFSPNQIEEKSLENKYFPDIYDFHRLVRVKEHEDHIQ